MCVYLLFIFYYVVRDSGDRFDLFFLMYNIDIFYLWKFRLFLIFNFLMKNNVVKKIFMLLFLGIRLVIFIE